MVTALSKINSRQEHNNIFRVKQFGELYDRWGAVGPNCYPTCPKKRPYGARILDRYEANESFFYEIMSIARRGGPHLTAAETHYSS